MMGGFGSLFITMFGVLWTILAFGLVSSAPFPINVIFPLFGVCFVLFGIAQTVFHFKNATQENRYSSFDVVDGEDEPDPLNVRFGKKADRPAAAQPKTRRIEGSFCPYCRADLQPDFEFCPKCGADV